MSGSLKGRKSLPSPAHVDDLYERLKHHDGQWLAATLQERWDQISSEVLEDGVENVSPDTQPLGTAPRRPLLSRLKRRSHQGKDEGLQSNTSKSSLWPFDITARRLASEVKLSEYTKWVRDHEWTSTDFGPMSSWSSGLRRMVNICLTDPRPAALWWGKSRSVIYNEGYVMILSRRHPGALGRPFADVWPELAEDFATHFAKGEETGQASMGDNALFMTERDGYAEELWSSWALLPIPADDGGVSFYNVCFDTTQQVLTERRMSTLGLVQQATSSASDAQVFWRHVRNGLDKNRYDVPFAVLYAAAKPDDMYRPLQKGTGDASDTTSQAPGLSRVATSSEYSSLAANRSWTLEGIIGLPADCAGLPSRIDGEVAEESLTPLFSAAIASGSEQTLLSVEENTFPKALQGLAKSRAFGDLCTQAVMCPISPAGKENVLGFMLIGINPCHVWDKEYKEFIQLLVRQMANSLASVLLVEEELTRVRAAAELAAQDRIRLSEQLADTQKRAEDSESRFRTMAENAPVAMYHYDDMGNLIYANETYFKMTQHPRDVFSPFSWMTLFHPNDVEMMMGQWDKVAAGESIIFEMRLVKPFVTQERINGEQVQGDSWVIASAYALKRDDGSVKSILGCLVDISRQKWIERYHSRRTEEAMELKRQQENFMDLVSHEARNPLSAITLCAENIATELEELLKGDEDPVPVDRAILESQLEAAEIITSCASHQKRIIDDVLTLSKLDSGLLAITPIDVQPIETIRQGMRMFDAEILKAGIAFSFDVAPTYKTLDIDWVRLDPSRLLQILINLLSNAIKFTSTQDVREISITLDASHERPETFDGKHPYLDNPTGRSDFCGCSQEDLYVSLSVRDTGRGITPEEMKRLFKRFQQANPKTHVKYGGSGLGLFTCRELARLHGGQIGVSSIASVGSTFAFYIRGHPSVAPVHKVPKKGSSSTLASRASQASRHSLNRGHAANSANSTNGHTTAIPLTAGERQSETMSTSKPKPISDQHLLVVEDNLVNQKVMSRQLRTAGYTVSVANHGLEALSFIRASHFHARPTASPAEPLDIVLMDVEMPVMDGLTAAQQIRTMQANGELQGHVPVVAVTANARAEQQAKALEAGMDSVVTKPFKMVELLPELERIRRALG